MNRLGTTSYPMSFFLAAAGFFRIDNSEKPSYHVLKEKVTKEWHTESSAVSSSDGLVSFEGFRGVYELSAKNAKCKFQLDGKKEIMELQLS